MPARGEGPGGWATLGPAADGGPGQILAATLTPPPAGLGVTHWSSRLLADHLGVDASTVLRTWRHHRVQPWRVETFKFSTDPELVAKVTDVVGLYLHPPENAIVLSMMRSPRSRR